MFSLSPNNNARARDLCHLQGTITDGTQISESFRRFGISEATTHLIAVKVSTSSSITQESVRKHLTEAIEGTSLPFSDLELSGLVDLPRLGQIYKLNPGKSKSDMKSSKGRAKMKPLGSGATDRKEVEAWILSAMALRGAV